MQEELIRHEESLSESLIEISPEVVLESIKDIKNYSVNVEKAKKSVQEISEKAQIKKATADVISEKANSIKRAKKWHSKTNILNGLVETVKDLAPTTSDIADSQVIIAETQKDTIDALKIVFENQENLSKVTSWMIWMSTLSFANANFMAKRLEELLSEANEEPLSETARSELISIAKQIHIQQSVHEKRERQNKDLKNRISITEQTLYQQMQNEVKTVKRITDIERLTKEYNRLLRQYAKKNEECAENIKSLLENIADINERVTVIEQAEIMEKLEKQKSTLDSLKNTAEEIINENMEIKKMMFWHRIFFALFVVLIIISFFI